MPKKNLAGRKRKRTALVRCRSGAQFWTTQTQFWQWVRERKVIKSDDHPLTGSFIHDHEELLIILSNTVLNLATPHHLQEALASRRRGKLRR